MAAEYPHFKIHVAKAKDLPLSWFELILCPDKFRKHLETLSKNPDGVQSLKIIESATLFLAITVQK